MGETQVQAPQLSSSLEAVRRWRAETEQDVTRQVKEIDEEEERLKASIAELQRQLKAVAALRDEVKDRFVQLDEEELERTRDAVVSGLAAEVALLEERALKYDLASSARQDSLTAVLDDPEVSALVEEYKQFVEAEPTLDLLPAGYRKAVLAHHEGVKARLGPVFSAADAEADPIDADPAGFTVLATLNPPEGRPEALAIIVPVPFDVYAKWSERAEDLYSLLAYRVVGAVSATLAELGAASAPVQYAPFEGRLAIQVWLGGHSLNGDVRASLDAAIAKLGASSAELAVARLSAGVVWLPPEAIVAEDDEEEEDDEDVDLEDDEGEEDFDG